MDGHSIKLSIHVLLDFLNLKQTKIHQTKRNLQREPRNSQEHSLPPPTVKAPNACGSCPGIPGSAPGGAVPAAAAAAAAAGSAARPAAAVAGSVGASRRVRKMN